MVDFLGIQIEIFAGVVIPVALTCGIVTGRIIRYLVNKEICFKALKEKVKQLDESDSSSNSTHGNLYEKLNTQSNRITKLETKVDLLLTHFKINID